MEEIQTYVLRIAVAAILGAVIMTFIPAGKGQEKLMKMICGFFLLLVVCAPINGADISLSGSSLEILQQQARDMTAQAQKEVGQELRTVITQQVQTYIEDKAAELGSEVSAQVTLDGDLIPHSVTMEGAIAPYYKNQLTRCIAEQLDIPEERQVWRSR